MLRISYSESSAGQLWNLCGQLAGPWVDEFRVCWNHARTCAPRAMAVVNLRDVTFIDESGETLLSEMREAGVEFVAAGVETKHLLENLTGKGERPLRRLMGSWANACCASTKVNKNKTKGDTDEKSK